MHNFLDSALSPDWAMLAAEALSSMPVLWTLKSEGGAVHYIKDGVLQSPKGAHTPWISAEADFSALAKDWNLLWKGKPWTLENFHSHFRDMNGVHTKGEKLEITRQCNSENYRRLHSKLLYIADLTYRENLQSPLFWSVFERHPTLKGFKNTDAKVSEAWLQWLYEDQFQAAEKKSFVIDLEKSHHSYLQSLSAEGHTLIDATAQIASLALGMNASQKKSMTLRPEMLDEKLNLAEWDVSQGLSYILRNQSGLSEIVYVNSGSEAIEVSLRACQSQYPDRRKIIAFKNSFHGRTLLSLHTTYSPSKREPFEIYKDIVTFVDFPEQSDPQVDAPIPEQWHNLWAKPQANLLKSLSPWLTGKNALLKKECEVLYQIYSSAELAKPLAVIVEPMQCEGGDKYASARFFQALRLLTRSLDVPLIFDEVQTGFGLGGSFFWHSQFQLITADGNKDYPDAICIAKKSQVGACISRFEQDIPMFSPGVSALSLYRGYLQAQSVDDYLMTKPDALSDLIRKTLISFQSFLGNEYLIHPRAQGLCFAFDLPSPEFLNQLIAVRFENGILFYPAGDRTARFRLLIDSDAADIAKIFTCLYACYQQIKPEIFSKKISDWQTPHELRHHLQAQKTSLNKDQQDKVHRDSLPWPQDWIPQDFKSYQKMDWLTWTSWFGRLLKNCPQLIRSTAALGYSVEQLLKIQHEVLWNRYQHEENFTLIDLIFNSSRAFGYQVHRHGEKEILCMVDSINRLEAKVYEPERQDDPLEMAAESRNPRAIFLAAWPRSQTRKILDQEQVTEDLMGISMTVPLRNYSHLALIQSDPAINDPHALYSMDLTISPGFQSKGLGQRLKVEAYLEATRQGATLIRSRNRFPEAAPMTHLNRRLSAVIINENPKDYGGKGLGLYQSIELHSRLPGFPVHHPLHALMMNKISLANFVSLHYVRHMLFLKSVLPPALRHVYLASGEPEACDKVIKLLKTARPKAHTALSFLGDQFGQTTACTRSLGGKPRQLRYFQWPVFKTYEELSQYVRERGHEHLLGIFADPSQHEETVLKKLKGLCRSENIPLVFTETRSAFYQYNDRNFWASQIIEPDAFILQAGPQLGVAAVEKKLFLATPLAMISTWDGDEAGLALFCKKILESLK